MNEIYKQHNIGIVITRYPNKKKPVLAVLEGNSLTKVASFDGEVAAEWFVRKFEEWCGMSREESEC